MGGPGGALGRHIPVTGMIVNPQANPQVNPPGPSRAQESIIACLGLAWLACCALPSSSSNNNSGGAAAAGRRRRPVVVAGPGQGKAGKAGKTGPGQTKPRQGTTSKPAKGVLAGPGTPRDPKSHLFVTKWVAIQPFCAILQPNLRRISVQISPDRSHPLNINFCFTFLDQFFMKKTIF